ncbi:hypothetical protein [Vibrio campbellii]|uniref:hypothetical protein n=1 Tax=Vibrio campbellii TaxID=680 RepID=UPI001F39284F|nr:hypothetical protein [Vibrio campbellii]MCE7729647.1 hypothetical protein [Vibrio campbellii]
MSIEKLRKAIAPCCGLGANRTEVDEALNEVEALVWHREHLLMEVLNVLQSSLDAMKGDRFQEDEIINHLAAMDAIRTMFSSTSPCIEKFHENLLSAFGDGWFEGFEKARQLLMEGHDISSFNSLLMSEDEEDVNKFGVLHKKLREENKQLNKVVSSNLGKSEEWHIQHLITLIRTIRVSFKKLPNGHCIHRARIFGVQCWPWSTRASIKSIERRIQTAIKSRDFSKAQRLDNVKQALCFLESNPIELGAMA